MPGKLDRKRPYGTVYGDPNFGFVQDEKYFRHDGTLYESQAQETPQKTSSEPIVQPARTVSDDRKAAQSAAMKKLWADRRARAAEATEQPIEP